MELDRELCLQAILARDRRFDGRFFTGVVTTGIYCRPVCPVRPPKFENMKFYACAAAAEAAGFRPCKRCRPESAPGTPAWAGTSAVVSRALRLIADGGFDHGDLDGFASRLGLGERQLRRLFAQHLGASPAEVARARRVHFARRLLDETSLSITGVALAAGFASIRQFNHQVQATFRTTPTALRARRGSVSPVGDVVVKLPYRPPLAWDAMLGFLAYRAIPGVEQVDSGVYRRTIESSGEGGWIEIDAPAADHAAAPHHVAHLRMRISLPAGRDLLGVVEGARRIFDLGADAAAIDDHLAKSPLLTPLVAAVPGLRVPGGWDGFELAVRAVLGQQVTVQGASTLAGRLVREFGRPLVSGHAALTHLFPKPYVIAEADLARIGLTRARAAALRALAAAVAAGQLRFDAALGLDDAIARVAAIPGLGPWTAHYIAMRAMGEPDAFPETDLGLRRALGSKEELASVRTVRDLADAWRPWRSYAAMRVWSMLHTTASSELAHPEKIKDRPPTRRASIDVPVSVPRGIALDSAAKTSSGEPS